MKVKKLIELIDADICQRGMRVLSDVTLEVEQREFVYIVGKVGTGKTSLIKTLNAELPLLNGIGKVAGFDLNKITHNEIAQLRRKIGVVFQDFRLLTDRSVFENLAFVLKATGWTEKEKIKQRIEQVLSCVGMQYKYPVMPHQLSGGEQQRVVIARAILNNPVLLLADEPTGNLDPETSSEILDLFIELNREGKTVVMASHDYAVIAKHPARTIACKNGKITDSADNDTHIEFEKLLEKN